MSISIGSYEFEGPFKTAEELEEKQGIYAFLHYEAGEYELIHLAEAVNVRTRIEISHSAQSSSSVLMAACYTPRSGSRERRRMIQEIQTELDEDIAMRLNKAGPLEKLDVMVQS